MNFSEFEHSGHVLFAIEPHREGMVLEKAKIQVGPFDKTYEDQPMFTSTLPVEGFMISEESEGVLVVRAQLGRQALQHVVPQEENLHFGASVVLTSGDRASVGAVATLYAAPQATLEVAPQPYDPTNTRVWIGYEPRLTVSLDSPHSLKLARLPATE